MPFKVVATRILPPDAQARLEAENYDLVQWKEDNVMPRDELLKQVNGADALICLLTDRIDSELLDVAGPQLKTVITMSVGFDHVDVDALRKRSIPLGYTPDVLTDAVADLTVLLTLAAARRMKEGMNAASQGEWGSWRPTWLCGSQFTGKTLGIIGMGRIGEAVAQRLKPFGISRTLYWGRREKPEVQERLPGAQFKAQLDDVLAESDYVIVCCALTPETKEMFNYEAFKKMKKCAVFVNTARGSIVQQDDLTRALEENLIASAGLDVTSPEPLDPSHKLYQLPNCVILPHIASATFETRERMASMCLENLQAALNNQTMPYSL
ncbi:D-isomer specific 2-hydroxyacid dehydrogenase [Phascolomyces articulosus]|uniref:D-isomer specific 2-hydroxyacid dehydrogenase n=1 Tax=Phascolomyces articulosus TaxID=60185 RepID=A0AAD5PCZ8_9FUNG|nr:D-isomer specific 2-hydroxyacid dehydrogenase [Phascolomyces articulosus]